MINLNIKKASSFLFLISLTFFQAQITNEKIWSGFYYPQGINGIQSLNDGKHYVTLDDSGIQEFSYETQQPTGTIVSGKFDNYKFNSDEKYVLVETDAEKIYRHSELGVWKVYNVQNKSFTPIFDGKKIQEPTFSPDASKVAFVYENNLYYQDLSTNKVTQITIDGEKNKIINGICDWVYEEEFGFVRHFDWNSDGSKIAFVRFDESQVPEMEISMYQEQLYPNIFKFKYPKAGEPNSTVMVHIYDLKSSKTQMVDLSKVENYYVPKIKFTNKKDDLFIITSNRHQNQVSVNHFDLKNNKLDNLFIEKDAKWIDTDNLTLEFLPDNSFVWNSERTGYRHLYLYSPDGKNVKPLTMGDWEVTELYGVDADNGAFYYQSTQEGAINRTVYKGFFAKRQPELLSEKDGFNEAEFSNDYSYFINNNSKANQPPVYTLRSNKGQVLKVLQDNQRVAGLIKSEGATTKEFIKIPNSAGQEMNAWIIKPGTFSSAKKYPVLMYVYGGPGAQTVENSWDTFNFWWFQELAQKGYIVVSVDGRGTGGRGADYKKCTYKELGKYEIEDQITAAKWLGKQSYVDAARIGMFGWSFGGYMTSLAMTKGADTFSTGIAVAPVTNWRYYDTVYTERFMQTPQENPSGYDDNSPINYSDLLKGNYLIIHGTGDDNVHFQNSVEMIESLVQANKQFDVMIYPDKNHGIYGGKTRTQLYNKMTDYLLKNL